jgi:hypothetical protein
MCHFEFGLEIIIGPPESPYSISLTIILRNCWTDKKKEKSPYLTRVLRRVELARAVLLLWLGLRELFAFFVAQNWQFGVSKCELHLAICEITLIKFCLILKTTKEQKLTHLDRLNPSRRSRRASGRNRPFSTAHK